MARVIETIRSIPPAFFFYAGLISVLAFGLCKLHAMLQAAIQ